MRRETLEALVDKFLEEVLNRDDSELVAPHLTDLLVKVHNAAVFQANEACAEGVRIGRDPLPKIKRLRVPVDPDEIAAMIAEN